MNLKRADPAKCLWMLSYIVKRNYKMKISHPNLHIKSVPRKRKKKDE